MHKIENAIIMAAGFGTRMRPLTYTTPKPLVKVDGVAMIESVIDSLHQNNIKDITIVVGYLAEKFTYLTAKYKGVRLVTNPYFDQYNNISSLYVVRERLRNTVILDGDQIINNPAIIGRNFENSSYAGSWTDTWSDEWVMRANEDKFVQSCDRDGGSHGWRLYSLSKWTKEDSVKLRKYLELEFEDKRQRDIYWDDVPMFKHFSEFSLKVQPIDEGDIIEIDSIEQLKAIDPEHWGNYVEK
ncbi:NTP transferase domain-containing protein [Limosilactobacillus reuteri]|uniref:NTP transferase domain-containing protein n=1 Tax=Limosilactobacillus reuteri TaxID=1598 RepID=UPI00098FD0F3|nr:NTP transferase domain-containing protein [Limosilactobacillus reuteri]WOZ75024.1 NTP transferase domain-containing protein [Limosilactobacillus reuteri]